MPLHILVVDADPAIQQLLDLNLGRAGHWRSFAPSAEAALRQLSARADGSVADPAVPDLLLLDWDLPDQCGMSLVRQLRAGSATAGLPIIMLSARSGEHDKIMALEAGADDYLTKPFSPRELIARIHAVLRRGAPQRAPDLLHLAGLRLDPATHRVTTGAGATPLALGRVEYRLLNFLMRHPERVHSRAQLLDQVWGSAVFLDERTVDTHVGRLRHALQPSGHQQHIETVRGSGYRLRA